MYLIRNVLQNSENMEEVTSPIEFFRISHTNKDGVMTTEAQNAYVRHSTIANLFLMNKLST